MRRFFLALPALLLPLTASAQTTDIDRGAATITAEDFYRRIGIIAHDSMRGRNTPSPELDQVAHWIGEEFRAMGLRPAGDNGTFIQSYPLVRVALDAERSSISTSDGATLRYGPDVVPLGFGSPPQVDVEGPVVVIHGAQGLEEAVAGASLAGAHVVVVPEGMAAPQGRRALGSVRGILSQSPASLLIASAVSDGEWMEGVRASLGRSSTTMGEPSEGGTPLLQVRDASLARILGSHGVDMGTLRAQAAGAAAVTPVEGLTLTVSQRLQVTRTSAPNVVGILEGSDPELRDEYVAFSGHMDHVGVRQTESGDSIFNGADDDASGTILVVEVAEALASLETAPRRSMLFVVVSGEERGLWGSGYFAENPTVPIENIVADLNADMVGRNWPDTIVAIGKEHSDLGATLERVNAAHPEIGMTAIDDRWPEQNFYRRSDHFNFARRGVPILFFFNGTHEDYHQASDELEKIDAEKTARIGKLVYYLGVEIGNAEQPPQWNPESYREIVGGGGL